MRGRYGEGSLGTWDRIYHNKIDRLFDFFFNYSIYSSKDMSDTALILTPEEKQLVDDLKLNGHGLGDYGVRMFKGSLVFYLGELYEWLATVKLWKVAKAGIIQYRFATAVLKEMEDLEGKVRVELQRLERLLALTALDKPKAVKDDKYDDDKVRQDDYTKILGYIKKGREIMTDASKQTSVWRLIKGRVCSDGRLLNDTMIFYH